jgi:hypothetical protein
MTKLIIPAAAFILAASLTCYSAQPNTDANAPKDANLAYDDPNLSPRASAKAFHKLAAPVLTTYVNENGVVDYRTLSRKKLELITVLREFKDLDPQIYSAWSTEDQLAFWLNAYNLNTLKIILDNYPIQPARILLLFWPPKSIKHIKGIWDQYKFLVLDEEFTLQAVDKQILRRKFDDPRVIFAMSFASQSSPILRNEPYCGEKLDKQLDEQARRFLADPDNFKIDRQAEKVYLSVVLRPTWFGEQFIEKYGTDKKFKDQEPAIRAVLNFITEYADPQDVEYIETGNYTIEYNKYDWNLNDSN